MILRSAVKADIVPLREMLRLSFAEYLAGIGRDWTGGPQWLEERVSLGRVRVSETRETGLAGMMAYSFVPDATALIIDMLAVHPDRQGQGLGRALIVEAETIARQAGARGLRLHTVAKYTPLVQFYQRAGFSILHLGPRRDEDDGHLRAYFEKQLD